LPSVRSHYLAGGGASEAGSGGACGVWLAPEFWAECGQLVG